MDRKKMMLYGGYAAAGLVGLFVVSKVLGGGAAAADTGSPTLFLPTSGTSGGTLPYVDPNSAATVPAATAPGGDSISAALQAALAQLNASSTGMYSQDASAFFASMPGELYGAHAIGAHGNYTVNGVPITFNYSLDPLPLPPPASTGTVGNPTPTTTPPVTSTPGGQVSGPFGGGGAFGTATPGGGIDRGNAGSSSNGGVGGMNPASFGGRAILGGIENGGISFGQALGNMAAIPGIGPIGMVKLASRLSNQLGPVPLAPYATVNGRYGGSGGRDGGGFVATNSSGNRMTGVAGMANVGGGHGGGGSLGTGGNAAGGNTGGGYGVAGGGIGAR